jgi:F0F1-type ATP synthase assembly protein I
VTREGDEGIGLADVLGLGVRVAALIALGIALGWLIDSLCGTFPVFVFVGLGLAIVGACAYTVVEFRAYLSQTDTPDQNH